MTDTNPSESLDAEGIPAVEEDSPGRDIELNEEAMMAPRDYPIAAGADPAYPVTAAEQRQRESVAERAAREVPDVGARELDVGGGAVGTEGRRFASIAGSIAGPLVEEDGENVMGADPSVGLTEPDDAADGELLADLSEPDSDDLAVSAEESAVHEIEGTALGDG